VLIVGSMAALDGVWGSISGGSGATAPAVGLDSVDDLGLSALF
jgi:hypothetical protein